MKRNILLVCLAFFFIAGCAQTVIFRNNDTREEWKITAKRSSGKPTISVNDEVVIVAWPGKGQDQFEAKGTYLGHKVELHQDWIGSGILGHWDAMVWFDDVLAATFDDL